MKFRHFAVLAAIAVVAAIPLTPKARARVLPSLVYLT